MRRLVAFRDRVFLYDINRGIDSTSSPDRFFYDQRTLNWIRLKKRWNCVASFLRNAGRNSNPRVLN